MSRRELKVLLKSGTTDPQAFLLLGVVERTAGDLPRAIATLRKGRALAPESEQLSMELATTLAWNRDLDEAIALFQAGPGPRRKHRRPHRPRLRARLAGEAH